MTETKFRADQVGSLLRPESLLDARRRRADGKTGDDELRAAENAAIGHAVALQVEAGIDVVTDGEFRRRDFRFHVCRGNQSSMWMGEGDYEPIAEQAFASLPVDRFLLEYDDDLLSEVEQYAKLALVAQVARATWGE